MIYGLGAALGWGLGDLWAAMSGRRIGALATVVIAQLAGAILVSLIVLASGASLAPIARVAPWLIPNALVMAGGYFTLYRGLELGPVVLVSPVLASYALLPVLLAVILLGESLSPLVVAGIVVTIVGTALTSTDLRALARGTHQTPEALPWAVASVLLFGVGTFVFGWGAKRAGWLPALWVTRLSTTAVFLLAGAGVWMYRRGGGGRASPRRQDLAFAALLGLVDLLGGMMYARGGQVGYISIVSAASATYPIIPVLGGMMFFRERPVPNQYLGVLLVVTGLLAVGLG